MQTVDKVVMIPVEQVIPYEKNPRKHSRTVDLLVEIIPKVGFNVPLVLDSENVIVKGHARYEAAKRLGMAEVPCVYSTADPEAIKADRIADNKVFEFTTWINDELMHEMDMIDIDFDPTIFGLPDMSKMEGIPDFSFDDDEEEWQDGDDEERRRRFEEFMAKAQAEAEAHPVEIVSAGELKAAKAHQGDEVKEPAKYYAVKCEKCGKILFVREGDAMIWE